MAGSPIACAKEGIVDMITYLGQAGCNNLTLIEYQSSANRRELSKMSLDERLNIVKSINGGGGTSFKSAFDEIRKSIT